MDLSIHIWTPWGCIFRGRTINVAIYPVFCKPLTMYEAGYTVGVLVIIVAREKHDAVGLSDKGLSSTKTCDFESYWFTVFGDLVFDSLHFHGVY